MVRALLSSLPADWHEMAWCVQAPRSLNPAHNSFATSFVSQNLDWRELKPCGSFSCKSIPCDRSLTSALEATGNACLRRDHHATPVTCRQRELPRGR